jgi:N-acetylmuramoyl-L-alanine amidase
MQIQDHRLVGVEFIADNMGGPLVRPQLIVPHYTATVAGRATARALQTILPSCHVLVERDGSMIQQVPFDRIAFHAGKSTWRGIPGCNGISFGIEIVNPGPVLYDVAQKRWEDIYGRPWTGGVIEARHRNGGPYTHWATYTEPQIESVEELCAELIREYTSVVDFRGHDEVAPGRKIDPGPAFPSERMRGRLFESRAEDGPDLWEALDILNRRGGPGVEHAIIAAPLAKGDRVEITSVSGVWKLTRSPDGTEAWVNSRYLQDV